GVVVALKRPFYDGTAEQGGLDHAFGRTHREAKLDNGRVPRRPHGRATTWRLGATSCGPRGRASDRPGRAPARPTGRSECAGGRVVASGTSPVTVFHEAEATGLHPFFICVGREDEPCRIRARAGVVAVQYNAQRGVP